MTQRWQSVRLSDDSIINEYYNESDAIYDCIKMRRQKDFDVKLVIFGNVKEDSDRNENVEL